MPQIVTDIFKILLQYAIPNFHIFVTYSFTVFDSVLVTHL